MFIDQLSTPLTKALQQGNSHASQWALLDMLGQSPELFYGDGVVVKAKNQELVTPQRLFLLPYAEGAAGSQFSVRVYGWQEIARPDIAPGAASYLVWIPFLIAEIACTVCNRGGPAIPLGGTARLMKDSEQACDTIALTQGVLGQRGYINSTGPGTDLIAWAVLELPGPRRFSFDFQMADTGNDLGMNCHWAAIS